MSTAFFAPYFLILFWFVVLAIFFWAIYHLAKSETPSRDLVGTLMFGSSWELTAVLGVIALAVTAADKWRDELDAADENNNAEEATIDE